MNSINQSITTRQTAITSTLPKTTNTSPPSAPSEAGSSQKLTDLLDLIYGKNEDLQGEIGSLGDLLDLLGKGNDLLAEITTNISRFINFVHTKASQGLLSYADLSAAEKKRSSRDSTWFH